MTAVGVFVVAALAVAGPDLVTVGEVVRAGAGRAPRLVRLVACITVAHTVLIVAGLRAGGLS